MIKKGGGEKIRKQQKNSKTKSSRHSSPGWPPYKKYMKWKLNLTWWRMVTWMSWTVQNMDQSIVSMFLKTQILYDSGHTIHWNIVWCRLWKPWRPLFHLWFFIHWKRCTKIHSLNHLNYRAPFYWPLTKRLERRSFRKILRMSKRKKKRWQKIVGILATEEIDNPDWLHEIWI